MAAKRGKDMLIEYDSGSSTFVTLGGLRSRRLRMGRETIDVTTADSANLERVLLSGGGVFSMSISGDGVFEDTSAQAAVEAAVRAGTFLTLKITVPDYCTYQASFAFTDMEFGGDHNTELSFSVTMESAGSITFTAL